MAAFAAYALVVRAALAWRGGPEPGFGLAAHVTLASLGATRIVAAAGAGGIAVTYWCFRRARFSTREALVRVLGMNTLVYLVFGAGAWVAALLATLGVLGEAPLALTVPWLALVPFCLVAARFVTEPSTRRPTHPLGWVAPAPGGSRTRSPEHAGCESSCVNRRGGGRAVRPPSTGRGTWPACGRHSTPWGSRSRSPSSSLRTRRGTRR